jgi:hypothetical protein
MKADLIGKAVIPNPIPKDRLNMRDSNVDSRCGSCGFLIGSVMCISLKSESVDWGHGMRAHVCRVALCLSCHRGEKPLQDPTLMTRSELKKAVLNTVELKRGKTIRQIAKDAGLRNSEYLAEFMYGLRDDGEVSSSRGEDQELMEPVWRLASE